MSYIQAVTGRVDPDRLARVMHHEHLLALTPGPWLSGGRGSGTHDEDQVLRAVGALSRLAEFGFNTVVDLSPYGVVGRSADGSNVGLLKEISERSEVYIVAGTAVYLESFSPDWTRAAGLEEMTERFIADAEQGIGGSGILAGILGEQATGLDEITTHEDKCLRAAARAAKVTGLAIVTHTTHGTMALAQIEILREEGMDLSRVVIGHQDTHPDFDYVLDVAHTGVNIAFDTIGKETWEYFVVRPDPHQPDGEFTKRAYHRSDRTRMRRLGMLLEAGFEDQLLLSQDLTGPEVYLNPSTHGQWGYTYLAARFPHVDMGESASGGVTSDQYDKMLHANPLRLLTIGDRAAMTSTGRSQA